MDGQKKNEERGKRNHVAMVCTATEEYMAAGTCGHGKSKTLLYTYSA